MIKVFVKDTTTNKVLMDKELDGLYLVEAQRQDDDTFEAPRLIVGREEYAKAALHVGIYNVPDNMLEMLDGFQAPKEIKDGEEKEDEPEDDKAARAFLDGLKKALRWLSDHQEEAD